MDFIKIRGARTHNLKNINLDLPRNRLTVITGLSGSGKSSLAFDTLYAEGQRRYVESLSAYARQFLQLMEKPDVDLIEGLSPAISIEQKATSHNPRSAAGGGRLNPRQVRYPVGIVWCARVPCTANRCEADSAQSLSAFVVQPPHRDGFREALERVLAERLGSGARNAGIGPLLE